MSKVIQLFTDGEVQVKERKFTRLVGGFDNTNEVLTTKQIATLMNYEVKVVNQTINRNLEEFTKQEGFIMDLKEVTESDHNYEMLISLGFTKMAISKAKNIYILSKAGFLLYLKFAEGDKAVELYKEFLEDYFRTKAENTAMKTTIEQQIQDWKQKKTYAMGMTIMGESEEERMKALKDVEEANKNILQLEKSISEKEIIKGLESEIHLASLMEQAKGTYDMNSVAKVLDVQSMGRNKMFEWLRDNKILRPNNEPYQQYMKYFKVIFTTSPNGHVNNKTLVKPNGVQYLVKQLIKDGKIITKPVEQILNELESKSA